MSGNVRLRTAVKDLEELGNLIDRRRRVVDFGTQGVDEPSKKLVRYKMELDNATDQTYRSAKLINSIGSSSEGSCKLRESTKPSSACLSLAVPESAEPRRSNTSGPLS